MELRHEAARKAIHVTLAILPIAAYVIYPRSPRIVQMSLIVAAAAAFLFDIARRRPGRVQAWTRALVGRLIRDGEERRLLGSTFYFAALALSFVVFPRIVALAAMGFLILGDSAAALAGRAFGRRTLRPGKTLEGSAACLAACVVVALGVAALDRDVRLPVFLLGAAGATLGELFASGERDNLTMPLVSGTLMMLAVRSC